MSTPNVNLSARLLSRRPIVYPGHLVGAVFGLVFLVANGGSRENSQA